MPVKLTEDHRTYWNYQVITLAKGEEIPNGEFADHLIASGAPIEVEEAPPAPPADPDAVPQGTVAEILAWVGEDKDKAAKALAAEQAAERPRAGIVGPLEKPLATTPPTA